MKLWETIKKQVKGFFYEPSSVTPSPPFSRLVSVERFPVIRAYGGSFEPTRSIAHHYLYLYRLSNRSEDQSTLPTAIIAGATHEIHFGYRELNADRRYPLFSIQYNFALPSEHPQHLRGYDWPAIETVEYLIWSMRETRLKQLLLIHNDCTLTWGMVIERKFKNLLETGW